MGLAESAAVGASGRISDFCMMGPISFFSLHFGHDGPKHRRVQDDWAKQTLRWGIAFSLVFGAVMFTRFSSSPERPSALSGRTAR